MFPPYGESVDPVVDSPGGVISGPVAAVRVVSWSWLAHYFFSIRCPPDPYCSALHFGSNFHGGLYISLTGEIVVLNYN